MQAHFGTFSCQGPVDYSGNNVAVLIGYSIPWSSAGTFTANTLQLLIFSGTGSG